MGTAQIYVGRNTSGVRVDVVHPDLSKDCGDKGMRMMGDNCNISSWDSCEEVYNKFMECQIKGKNITINKKTCDKISNCKKQIDNFIQNKPHCLEPDWINDYTCFWYSVSSGARFLRGKGKEYASVVQDVFSALDSKCTEEGYRNDKR